MTLCTAGRQASLTFTVSWSFAQTHIHWVSDAIQTSYPLSPTSPPASNFSQHQGLFQWVSSLHQVAQVLDLQFYHEFFQWKFRVDFLYDWLVWFPCCPRDSQESSPTPQFKIINSSVLNFFMVQFLHLHMTTGKNSALIIHIVFIFVGKAMSLLINMLSRYVIAFLPRSKGIFTSMAVVTIYSDFGA